ncbi:MAG: hypothetical protein NC489_31390 [Ruminococcus flavefaciens]|nr:hypothetical protein [Ruminococcus flavefaciens]
MHREGIAPGRAAGGHGRASLGTGTGCPGGVGHFDVSGEEGQGGGLALPGSGDRHVRFGAQRTIHGLDLPCASLIDGKGVAPRGVGSGQHIAIAGTGTGSPSGEGNGNRGAEESQSDALGLPGSRDGNAVLCGLPVQLRFDLPRPGLAYRKGIRPGGGIGGQHVHSTGASEGSASRVGHIDGGAVESQRHALALSILCDAHSGLGGLVPQLGLDCPRSRSVYREGIAPGGGISFIDPPVAGTGELCPSGIIHSDSSREVGQRQGLALSCVSDNHRAFRSLAPVGGPDNPRSRLMHLELTAPGSGRSGIGHVPTGASTGRPGRIGDVDGGRKVGVSPGVGAGLSRNRHLGSGVVGLEVVHHSAELNVILVPDGDSESVLGLGRGQGHALGGAGIGLVHTGYDSGSEAAGIVNRDGDYRLFPIGGDTLGPVRPATGQIKHALGGVGESREVVSLARSETRDLKGRVLISAEVGVVDNQIPFAHGSGEALGRLPNHHAAHGANQVPYPVIAVGGFEEFQADAVLGHGESAKRSHVVGGSASLL